MFSCLRKDVLVILSFTNWNDLMNYLTIDGVDVDTLTKHYLFQTGARYKNRLTLVWVQLTRKDVNCHSGAYKVSCSIVVCPIEQKSVL